ncbi:MAG: AI-2E family transporter [Candidatus Daviesbacteria bacterium]|nr:AI-2E family transporter [Candidatus Daviesbacteria bacterium]
MTRRIDISAKTVIFIAAFGVLLWILFHILDIILLFFVAFILMSALNPLVERLRRWKVPKILAVILVFSLTLGIIATLLTAGLSPLVSQTGNLIQRLGETINTLLKTNIVDQSVIQQEVSKISTQVVSFTVNLFKNLISWISVLVVTIYMLFDREKMEDYVTSFFGERKGKVKELLRKIEDKLGAWLHGQIVLSVVVGTLVYIGLVLLRVEFALPLAIIAGLLEVVPVIGPIISSIPAILVGLTVSPLLAALIGGLYLAVQQVENQIIVPQVMRRAVGINPLLVILAVSIGGRLLGIAGALLAVPIAVVIQLVIQEGLNIHSEEEI